MNLSVRLKNNKTVWWNALKFRVKVLNIFITNLIKFQSLNSRYFQKEFNFFIYPAYINYIWAWHMKKIDSNIYFIFQFRARAHKHNIILNFLLTTHILYFWSDDEYQAIEPNLTIKVSTFNFIRTMQKFFDIFFLF